MKTGKRKSCDCDDPSVPHYPEDHLITPKPTGEWTAERMEKEHFKMRWGDNNSTQLWQKWCDEINSALAEATDAAVQEMLLVKQQLTAEREKVQTYEGALIKIANDPNCDRCQVAVDALAKVAK